MERLLRTKRLLPNSPIKAVFWAHQQNDLSTETARHRRGAKATPKPCPSLFQTRPLQMRPRCGKSRMKLNWSRNRPSLNQCSQASSKL
eukprot:14708_2